MSGAGYVRRAKRVVYENPWLRFEAHDIVHPTGAPGVHGVVVTPRASAVVLLEGDDVLLADRWTALGVTYEIPSIVQEPVELFLGTGLSPAPLAPEEVERIDVVRMPLADALEACADGRIDDAVTAIALLRAWHNRRTERDRAAARSDDAEPDR
jgi:hypothetical protein